MSLEKQLRQVVLAIIVFGEQALRDRALAAHAWRIRRKAELEEEERKRLAEEARRERAREAKAERLRIEHLLAQASALHRAERIRTYVSAVRELNAKASEPMPEGELEAWSEWALVQADRIDPVVSGAKGSHYVSVPPIKVGLMSNTWAPRKG